MSRKDSVARFVVTARLLGADTTSKKRGKEVEYAIEVELSDESKYTIYRTLKEVATFNAKILSRFPMEAGYFKKGERVIPDCPVKQTVFGPQRAIRDDRSFEKLLNSYIKELPALPASIVKSDLVNGFFSLKASDLDVPGETNKKGGKKSKGIKITDSSTITGPMALKSYYAVTSYKAKKGIFNFSEGDVVQVMQKDPSGWWMVDASGIVGWAPASYLVPVDDSTLQEETQENKEIIGTERAGTRYISVSSYQASRDDELSFVRGAVVRVLKKYIDGWWLVRYNGGEGFVPGAMFKKFDRRQGTVYVKKIQRNFGNHNRRSTRIMPTLKPNWMSGRRRNPDGSLIRKSNSETKNVAVYICKAQFKGSDERHELTINKGDHVNVLDKTDGGWWFVQDEHSRSGWIPATYLRPIVDNDSNIDPEGVVGTDREVIKEHTAQKDDEMTVNLGEIVEVIQASKEGWWLVRNTATYDQGLVPSVCLSQSHVNSQENGTPNGDHTRPRSSSKSTSNLELERATNSTRDMKSHSTSDLQSNVKIDLSSEADITSPDQLYDDPNDQYDEFDDDDNDLDSIDMEECYVVSQDYTKLALDELDVYEGQVVCIIDDSDRDMWYVNADGKEGWLPSNILRAMIGDEMATSGESTPVDIKLSSTGASADASDMSDSDDLSKHNSKPASTGRPFKRSKVIRKSSSQEPPDTHRPRLTEQQSLPSDVRKKSHSDTSSDGEALSSMGSSVTILVGDKTLEELEREAAEAERVATEASLKAEQLKEQIKEARRRSGNSY